MICELQRLPDDFVRKYGADISPIVTLTVPDGSVWRVGLKKEDKKFWFLNGWHEFVQNYSVGVGYLLLFRYEGKSSFNVNIFCLATSEINYQSPAQSRNEGSLVAKRLKIFEEMEDEDSIEILNLSPRNLTPSPFQNKNVSGAADKFTPGKSRSPPALQNLFNGSKLNSINWGESGNTPSSRSSNSIDSHLTRDIGLQFNVVEFKKSTEEVKLRAATDEKVKKTATKKRKSGPSYRLKLGFLSLILLSKLKFIIKILF